MRSRRKGVEKLVLLTLVAPAWVVMMTAAPCDVQARPPLPEPAVWHELGPRGGPGGSDSADPDALGNEAPALPPDEPVANGQLNQECAAPAASEWCRLVQAWVLEMQATGVVRLLRM